MKPVLNFPPTHPFTDGDQKGEWNNHSYEEKKNYCNGAHGNLLSFIPTQFMRKG